MWMHVVVDNGGASILPPITAAAENSLCGLWLFPCRDLMINSQLNIYAAQEICNVFSFLKRRKSINRWLFRTKITFSSARFCPGIDRILHPSTTGSSHKTPSLEYTQCGRTWTSTQLCRVIFQSELSFTSDWNISVVCRQVERDVMLSRGQSEDEF